MPEISSKNPDPLHPISFSALLNLFFKAFLQAYKDFVHFFFRNKALIIIFIITGIAAGVVNYKMSRVYYKLSMIVRHNELTLKTYGQMLNNLNALAESGSYDALSKSLKIDHETSRKIRTIEAVNLSGIDLRKDTSTSEENAFLIQMTIYDNDIADTLEKTIVNYFNNNTFLSKLKQDEIHLYTGRLEFLKNELNRMDSLKDAYTRSLAISKGSPTFYNNAFNPADIYKASNQYAVEKDVVEEWLLQKRNPIITMDSVKPSVAPKSISLVLSILIYVLIFFFIGCFLAGILEFTKK